MTLVLDDLDAATSRTDGFEQVFAGQPGTIVWTIDPSDKKTREALAAVIADLVAKAEKAKAELDVVTRGKTGAMAVARALQSLEGRKIGVNKVVSVGVSRPALKALDPAFFANDRKPANAWEWAFLWTDPGADQATMELNAGNPPAFYPVKTLVPDWSGKAADAAALAKRLIDAPAPIEKQLEQAARGVVVTVRSHDGSVFQRELTQTSPAAPQASAGDSLSMIRGGEIQAPAPGTTDAPTGGDEQSRRTEPASCTTKEGVGIGDNYSSQTACVNYHFVGCAKESCREVAEWKRSSDLRACAKAEGEYVPRYCGPLGLTPAQAKAAYGVSVPFATYQSCDRCPGAKFACCFLSPERPLGPLGD